MRRRENHPQFPHTVSTAGSPVTRYLAPHAGTARSVLMNKYANDCKRPYTIIVAFSSGRKWKLEYPPSSCTPLKTMSLVTGLGLSIRQGTGQKGTLIHINQRQSDISASAQHGINLEGCSYPIGDLPLVPSPSCEGIDRSHTTLPLQRGFTNYTERQLIAVTWNDIDEWTDMPRPFTSYHRRCCYHRWGECRC